MNAAGVMFVLHGVSGALGMPHFKSLVSDGSVSQGEFDGTRSNLESALTTLKKTPPDKFEALVAQYDEQLTEHLNKFNAIWGEDFLGNFREAQVMAGFVATIMAKAGLKE